MCDIDKFKGFNDSYGPVAGDDALKLAAQKIKESVRRLDVCARYGGEEFLVVLPETDLNEAARIGERIRSAVAGAAFDTGRPSQQGRLTISIGAAEFKAGESPTDFVGRADAALYSAKQSGRNRICC
jgi:diguanylate cyclase